MECDQLSGQCKCKKSISGRQCDKCVAGYYGFPFCYECVCAANGTTTDICDQNTAQCLCKVRLIFFFILLRLFFVLLPMHFLFLNFGKANFFFNFRKTFTDNYAKLVCTEHIIWKLGIRKGVRIVFVSASRALAVVRFGERARYVQYFFRLVFGRGGSFAHANLLMQFYAYVNLPVQFFFAHA